MKTPKNIDLLTVYLDQLSKGPYPPNGFLPVDEGDVGNGDVYGLYWPLGREQEAPIICDTLHDGWEMRVNFSNIKVFLLWLERYEARSVGGAEIRLEEDPHFARTHFLQAKQCLEEERFDAAVPLLQKACEELPEVSEYWSTLAGQYQRLGKDDEAIEALINAYCSNWSFGMPEASVLSSLAQAQENSKFSQDPLIQRADRLTLEFRGVKKNPNYGLMKECIELYFAQNQPMRALQIYQNYAQFLDLENYTFQKQHGFKLEDWQTEFAALCKEHLGNDRLILG